MEDFPDYPSSVPQVSVQVLDYNLSDDPGFYQHHVYTLQIWMEQNLYKIDRSYAAFVELDYKLRYQYPRSNLPALPLAGCKSSVKKAPARRFSTVTTDPNLPANTSEKSTKRKLMKRIDATEAIGQKKAALNQYMKDLLRVPEILVSEVILSFLDEESVDGLEVEEFDEDMIENLEIPLLLQDEEVLTKTVRKDFKLTVEVAFNQILLWTFTTVHHNIGFSATYNDIEVWAYQRYNSHERPVRGYLEVPNSGTISLTWDNSFSTWRSKVLNYTVKAVDIGLYEKAKVKAAVIRSKKIAFYKQRIILKKLLTKLSNELLMSMNPSKTASILRSTMCDLTEELGEMDSSSLKFISGEDVDVKGLFHQIEQLQNEKKFLQQALSESETALVNERTACAESMREFETINTQKDALEEELCEVRNELDTVRTEYQEFVAVQQAESVGRLYPIEALLEVPEAEAAKKGVAFVNFQQLLKYAKETTKSLAEHQAGAVVSDTMITKLKSERKQLKTFGIQSKERVETLERQQAHIDHEKDLVNKENQNLRARITTLEKTIAAYRDAAAANDMSMYGTLNEKVELPEDESGHTDERSLTPQAVEEEDMFADDEEAPKIIVHDFSQVEPDEVSQVLDVMAASIKEMLPSWGSMVGRDEHGKPGIFSFGF